MAQAEIKSPIPGTFYRKPAPDAANFVDDGGAVEVGQQIGLIEVMKTFIPVMADVAGTNIVFTVDNEEPVMAGQAIAEVTV